MSTASQNGVGFGERVRMRGEIDIHADRFGFETGFFFEFAKCVLQLGLVRFGVTFWETPVVTVSFWLGKRKERELHDEEKRKEGRKE